MFARPSTTIPVTVEFDERGKRRRNGFAQCVQGAAVLHDPVQARPSPSNYQ